MGEVNSNGDIGASKCKRFHSKAAGRRPAMPGKAIREAGKADLCNSARDH